MIRNKRVTGQLDDKVKALLRGDDCGLMPGYASSGSDHAGPSCFSGLLHAFFEVDVPDAPHADQQDADSDSDSDSDGGDLRPAEMVRDLFEESESLRRDPFRLRLRLLSDVRRLKVELAGHRRAVMARLRELGYNAGLCKAKWDACGGLVAGSHEYIDVVVAAADGSRYVVDLEFAGQFQIARETEEYGRAVAALPQTMVGTAEEVRQLVRIVCDAARRSLKRRGLHVPPWRKTRYMMTKWLGPYRRTTSALPSSASASAAADVKCRAVGFHPTSQLAVIPREARTR